MSSSGFSINQALFRCDFFVFKFIEIGFIEISGFKNTQLGILLKSWFCCLSFFILEIFSNGPKKGCDSYVIQTSAQRKYVFFSTIQTLNWSLLICTNVVVWIDASPEKDRKNSEYKRKNNQHYHIQLLGPFNFLILDYFFACCFQKRLLGLFQLHCRCGKIFFP